MRTLTPQEVQTFYDRFGVKQDGQSFYEAPALQTLVANSHFDQAASVFEFGCGTGHFALDLLTKHLATTAQYQGIDISTTMIHIASARLAPFAQRATVTLASEGVAIPVIENSMDRFVSNYVFDLLPKESAIKVLSEAYRVLKPGGLLCLVSLSHGVSPISRLTMGVWQRLFLMNPSWVGGCHPIELMDYLHPDGWQVRYRTVVVAWGIPSEVVVASPIKPG